MFERCGSGHRARAELFGNSGQDGCGWVLIRQWSALRPSSLLNRLNTRSEHEPQSVRPVASVSNSLRYSASPAAARRRSISLCHPRQPLRTADHRCDGLRNLAQVSDRAPYVTGARYRSSQSRVSFIISLRAQCNPHQIPRSACPWQACPPTGTMGNNGI